MLVQNVTISPVVRNVAEVRSLLEVNMRNNPSGLTGALTRPVFGDLFSFGISALFENMEALEKARDTAESNPKVQEYRAKIESLIRQPIELAISEIVVPGASDSSGRYRQLTQFFPVAGKHGEVQSILEELAKSRQAAGRPNFSCVVRLFSSSGPIISVRDTYETLAEQENVARQFTSSAAYTEIISKLPSLVRRPFSSGLRELIMPYGG